MSTDDAKLFELFRAEYFRNSGFEDTKRRLETVSNYFKDPQSMFDNAVKDWEGLQANSETALDDYWKKVANEPVSTKDKLNYLWDRIIPLAKAENDFYQKKHGFIFQVMNQDGGIEKINKMLKTSNLGDKIQIAQTNKPKKKKKKKSGLITG